MFQAFFDIRIDKLLISTISAAWDDFKPLFVLKICTKLKPFAREINKSDLFDCQLNFRLQRNVKEYTDALKFKVFSIHFPLYSFWFASKLLSIFF